QQQVNPGGLTGNSPIPGGGPTWTVPQSLGGFVRQITAAKEADGRVEVFAVGSDNSVWHITQATSGTWGGWQALGGWARQIGVAANADGHLEVFAVGADFALWHRGQAAPNSGAGSG